MMITGLRFVVTVALPLLAAGCGASSGLAGRGEKAVAPETCAPGSSKSQINSSDLVGRTPQDAIGALRASIARGESPFDPWHGVPSRWLFRILVLRNSATAALCDVIEGNCGRVGPSLRDALWFSLGVIKDPATIGWLGGHLVDKQDISSWLRGWLHCAWSPGPSIAYEDVQLLCEGDEWSKAFRELYDRCRSPDMRATLLNVMDIYFHDETTLAFVSSATVTGDASPAEVLAGARYIAHHGGDVTSLRLAEALTSMIATAKQTDGLLQVEEIRDASFVPVLVRETEAGSSARLGSCAVLSRITFSYDLPCTSRAWSEWWAEHGAESRAVWLEESVSSLAEMVIHSPDRAGSRFLELVDRMQYVDILMLPFVRRWMGVPEMREGACAWIRAVYHPAYDAVLRPTIEAAAHYSACGSIRELSFAREEICWEAHIERWLGEESERGRTGR